MEEPNERVRQRFKSMLESAVTAADWVAEDRPSVLETSSLMVAAVKAMNRAAGFLEAITIVIPELGPELLDQFEMFGARVEGQIRAREAGVERRVSGERSNRDDRRADDRRLRYDRRQSWIGAAVERRRTPDRRVEMDRRTGRSREFADRRWRGIQH